MSSCLYTLTQRFEQELQDIVTSIWEVQMGSSHSE